jgi:hypothetical protein
MERRVTSKNRVPVGGFKLKMSVSPRLIAYFKENDLHPCWVNDKGNALYDYEKGGYTFVENGIENRKKVESKTGGNHKTSNTDIGSRISMVVDKRDGTRAYLMCVKNEWYNEDRAAELQRAQDIDDDITRKGSPSDLNEPDKMYNKTKMESSTARYKG